MSTETLRLVGPDAISYAAEHSLTLRRDADGDEPARDGLSIDEATKLAKKRPELVHLDVEAALAIAYLARLCATESIAQGHSGYWVGDLDAGDLEALEWLVGPDREPTDAEREAFQAAFVAYFDEHAPEDPRG
jgi:hypothetical protein